MRIHCNACTTTTNMVGNLPGFGIVWYHPYGIANILSMANINKKFLITFDRKNDNEFVVHTHDRCHRRFKESNHGLYYMDLSPESALLVNTVADNKYKFTNRDYSRAILARSILRIIGRPSEQKYLKIVNNEQIRGCPVTTDDVRTAQNIFGPKVGSLQGKKNR